MARKKRTDQELQEASDHVHYEFWMLTRLAHGLVSGVAGKGPIANALLESFVIHVRVLLDFLYHDNPRPNDVIAQDYFSSPDEWPQLRPALSELLKEAKRRAGKELAHLTYARLDVTPETKAWPFVQIANEIFGVINVFLEHVPTSRLSKRWQTTNLG